MWVVDRNLYQQKDFFLWYKEIFDKIREAKSSGGPEELSRGDCPISCTLTNFKKAIKEPSDVLPLGTSSTSTSTSRVRRTRTSSQPIRRSICS